MGARQAPARELLQVIRRLDLSGEPTAVPRRRAAVRRTTGGAPSGSAVSRGVTGKSGAPRSYRVPEPTRSFVLNAFLRELEAGEGARLARSAFVETERARSEMWLLDQARLLLPRMLAALNRPELALTLFEDLRPNEEARDPRLYFRVTKELDGELGDIARDYERAVATGSRTFVSCVVAAFAGRLFALGARLLGPHVYRDLVERSREGGGRRAVG